MSRIYFHGKVKDTEVHGTERHYANVICKDIASAIIMRSAKYEGEYKDFLLSIARPKDGSDECLKRIPALWFETDYDGGFVINDILHSNFIIQLNTMLRMGNDPMKLYARLHGQCEIHAYVEGPNRQWLAEIIKEGLRTHIFRPDEGWETVIPHLEEADDSPIVTSFSVCDEFPNPYIAGFDFDPEDIDDSDRWYELPYEERWELGLKGLRNNHSDVELIPENWDDYYFGHGMDAFKLTEYIYNELAMLEAKEKKH